jgi:Fic family protein
LVNRGILKRPVLYLSDFFEKNRTLYYDNLTRVRTHNDINQWFKFFLTGVIETSKKGIETFDAIMHLSKSIEQKITKLGARSSDAHKIVTYLYSSPVIDAQKVGEIIEKNPQSAYQLINKLEKLEIIRETTGSQRNRLYVFDAYLQIFND